jgi:CheY-like chemotaxis protein
MDMQMPVMDGIEATRVIRGRLTGDRAPRIVAMTADVMNDDRERCISAGMDDFVPKPVRADSLLAVLQDGRPQDGGLVGDSRGNEVTEPVLDSTAVANLLETFADDASAINGIVEAYLDSAPGLIRAMLTAAQNSDEAGLIYGAHTLKSSSAIIGATNIARLCALLEQQSHANVLSGALDRVRQIEALYERVSQALDALRSRPEPDPTLGRSGA